MTLVDLKNYLQQMIDAELGEECMYFVDADESVYYVTGLDTDDEASLLLNVSEDAEESYDVATLYEALCNLDDDDDHEAYLYDEDTESYLELDEEWDTDEDGTPYMTCGFDEDEDDDEEEDDEDCEDCDDEDCDDSDCEDCDDCDCEDCDCEDDEDCCGCGDEDEDEEEEEDEDEDSEDDESEDEELDDDYYSDAVED